MSEVTAQAVVDATNTQQTAGSEVNGARNDGADLDTLLNQFVEETKAAPVSNPPATQQAPQTVQGISPDELASVKASIQQFQSEKFQADMGKLVTNVKGDLDFDNEMVEAWIDAQARRDPRLQRAWLERDTKPQAFQQVSRELGREFAKKVGKRPDPALTEDRDAVVAALRGASTNRAPEEAAPDFKGMSNHDFRRSVREKYGYDPG